MKKKKLILVAILLVITLNMNYLGLAGKKATITSKEYKEGNTGNLVLDKILSDNELKQEIPHMFNYTSNGNYRDNNARKVLNDPEYVTAGLYSNTDEDGTTYYYRGDVNNNNLQFGAYDEDYYIYGSDGNYFQSLESCQEAGHSQCTKVKLASKGDKIYWKIVRINGNNSLRLIYNGTNMNHDNRDLFHSYVIGLAPYNLSCTHNICMELTGYTYDNGTDSFIKGEVDTWYNNILGSNSNYDKYVIFGRFCSDSSGHYYDDHDYWESSERLGQADSSFTKDNVPTFVCPNTIESYGGSYKLKAGLITADELVFAGESYGVTGNSYLNPEENGTPYWSMTPGEYREEARYPCVWTWESSKALFEKGIPVTSRYGSYGIRPVINLSTEGMTLVGDGTSDNPYVLVEAKKNGYKGKVTIEEGSSVDDNSAFTEEVDLSGNITWTSEDENIAKIEDGKILGIKEGITTIRGIGEDGTTYEIEVTVIKNPITISSTYIVMGLAIVLVFATVLYLYYKKKTKEQQNK